MENINQQQQSFQQQYQEQQNFQRQEQSQNQSHQIKVCKHCNATLDEDMAFCPECGEKVGGEERICLICKTSSTSEFCPNCGQRLIPLVCPNCGKESFSDFCDECGTVLNPALQQMMEQPEQQIQQMSQKEAESIKQDIKNSITPEVKTFLNKIEEHRILLEERDYFKKREKRIIKVFGKNPLDFYEQDPEEQKLIMKAYEGLKKVVLLEKDKIEKEKKQKEEQQLQEEIKRKEVQQKYEKLLNTVTKEVQVAKENEKERIRKEEEERKRREEDERKRREEDERKRREEEERRKEEARKQKIFEDRILGTYIYHGDRYEMWMKFSSKFKASSYDLCHVCGNEICCTYDVVYDLHNIKLINPRVQGERDSCGFLPAVSGTNFCGTINESGTIINGFWAVASRTYMKVRN